MKGLEYLCLSKSIKYNDLADMLGIKRQNINAWIKGKRKIPDKYKPILSDYFHVSQEYLDEDIVVRNGEAVEDEKGESNEEKIMFDEENGFDFDEMDYLYDEEETIKRIEMGIKNIQAKNGERKIIGRRKNILNVYKWFARIIESRKIPPHILINVFKAVMIVYTDELQHYSTNEYVDNLVDVVRKNKEIEKKKQREEWEKRQMDN